MYTNLFEKNQFNKTNYAINQILIRSVAKHTVQETIEVFLSNDDHIESFNRIWMAESVSLVGLLISA